MYAGQVAVISNQAPWQSQVIELVDEDDSTIADLSDPALALDIVVTIKASDCSDHVLATASIANGKVTLPAPGFQWQFDISDLSNLCAGTYRLGVKVTVNGFVVDLIAGTIAVRKGKHATLNTTPPVISLSASTVFDTALIGDAVGTLSVSGGSGVYTYTLTSNPGGLFSITGNQLQVAAALTAGLDPITVQASNGSGSVVSQAFLITVNSSAALSDPFPIIF